MYWTHTHTKNRLKCYCFIIIFDWRKKTMGEIQWFLLLFDKYLYNRNEPVKNVNKPNRNEWRYLVVKRWINDKRLSVEVNDDEHVCSLLLISLIFISMFSFWTERSWRKRIDISESCLKKQQTINQLLIFLQKKDKRFLHSRLWMIMIDLFIRKWQ